MARTIDQIRASKLPSNMMQFAARGALQVPPAENIEILVYLARHNPVFGEVARMTLAGWDERASLAAAADPQTVREVLDYFISPDNLRPVLLPALLENPSILESQLVKVAVGASRESIEVICKSSRVRSLRAVLQALLSNPYLEKQKGDELRTLLSSTPHVSEPKPAGAVAADHPEIFPEAPAEEPDFMPSSEAAADEGADAVVSAYFQEHAHDIVSEGDKA